uniref:Serine/threonine-protein kinase Nek8 n=1 Tax=Electrophorus electricus TaxID=8005 RepID=A0AAY5EHL4_ELEEL
KMEKYEKVRVVGRGAFGIVHLCCRRTDGALVILKEIPVEQMTRDERLSAQNECQVLKLLNHPNIIEYYENFLEDKALMIAMEYAPGGTLAEYIQKRCNSLLDEDTILHFFVQILLALYHVHNRLILHRDLKTQNILLDKHQMILKIGDFGISKILVSKIGTPCYISPELCEGKPYNQKSDIWALGCVLYELASLKRAFEAANLPALVLKIMSGTFAPISDRYSPELRSLILNMLNLDPSRRPQLNEIMALPICIRPLLNLYTDIGHVKMRRIEKPLSTVQTGSRGRAAGRVPGARSGLSSLSSRKMMVSLPLSLVYTWGSGISMPLTLPSLGSEVLQVSLGRTQKMGVTKSGRLITWESPSVGAGEPALPGTVELVQALFIPRFLEGQSGVTIKSVSCGDLFTTCLTDRGIIMTFGSGSNGCLGHGNFNDVAQPKIVEALLGYELVQVSCGASHVLAVTNEREVFSWGRGNSGRLGLGTQDTHNSPQQVSVPADFEAQRVLCGVDCSVIISTQLQMLACGSNRFNKLGLDEVCGTEEPPLSCQAEEVYTFQPVQSAPLNSERIVNMDIGTAHSAAVTDKGQCFTYGSDQHGQLGCSSRRSSRVPWLVPGLQGVTMVACGDAFTLAIGAEGEVYTWGKGARGRLGRKEEDSGIPKAVQLDESHPFIVSSVACCHGNTLLAIKRNVA